MTDVLKFGGTSVGSAERILDVARLVRTRGGDPCLVVVSAMAGVTDFLVGLRNSSKDKERAATESKLDELEDRHRATLDGLALSEGEARSCAVAIDEEMRRCRELSLGISLLEEISPRTSDALLAIGELICSRLVAAALRASGGESVWIDPREILATNASYGAALADEKETAVRVALRVAPHLAAGRTVVTGGFVGAAPDGSTTTLGRGGSDYSAALFGAGALITLLGLILPHARQVDEAGLVGVAALASTVPGM